MASHLYILAQLPSANHMFAFGLLSNVLGNYSISWQTLYIIGTLIVAVLIAYESIVLKRLDGKLPQSRLVNLASILEMVWLAVSIAATYYGDFLPIVKAIPAAYILYSVVGWIYGFYLLKGEGIDVDKVDDIQMPPKYMNYTLSFAMVMMLTCAVLIAHLFYKGHAVLALL